jgi:hypothetical protein
MEHLGTGGVVGASVGGGTGGGVRGGVVGASVGGGTGGGVGATDRDASCSSLDQKSASSVSSILTFFFSAAEPPIIKSKANTSVFAFILIMISTCKKLDSEFVDFVSPSDRIFCTVKKILCSTLGFGEESSRGCYLVHNKKRDFFR